MTNNWRLGIFISSVILFILLPFTGRVMFSTPDDNMYLLITSGAYTGTPSAFTMFEGYIYSWFIAGLYSLTRSIEWYSVVHFALSIGCFMAIAWKILQKDMGTLLQMSTFLFVACIQFYFLISPQNTLLAFECAFTSIFVLLTYPLNRNVILTSLLLFFVGAEVRFQGAMIPYILLSPVFLKYINIRKPLIIFRDKRCLTMLCFFVIAILSNYHTHQMYNTEEWQYYKEYNAQRGFINDNPKALDAASGIENPDKKQEYELMCTYRVNDGTILNAKELKEIKNTLANNKIDVIKENIIPYANSLYHLGGVWIILMCVISFYSCCNNKSYLRLTVLLSAIFVTVVALLYVMSISVPKDRVILPILLSFVCTLCFLATDYMKKFKRIITVTALSLCILYVYKSMITYMYNPTELASISEANKLLERYNGEKVLVHNGVPVRMEAFHCSQSALGQKMVRVGWLIHSPLTKKYYTSFLSYIDNLPMMIDKKNLKHIDKMRDLIYSHYGVKTELNVMEDSERFAIVKLVSQN